MSEEYCGPDKVNTIKAKTPEPAAQPSVPVIDGEIGRAHV